jgi:hypothetical protein
MFHSNTELLIGYWRSLRGEDAVPARASVDPAAFVAVAPRVFIAGRDVRDAFVFRLAGESLIDLHGRPLHGQTLSQLWRPLHRRRLEELMESALAAGEPLVISAEAWTAEGSHVRLEVLFLPLAGPSGLADRFLGLYQPHAGVWRGPIGELALLSAFGVADEAEQPHLRLATLDGRQIA